jgi:hypothetical protein
MATRLSDGIPVTTEWLNSLVEEINALRNNQSNNSTGSAATAKAIEFMKEGLS